MLEARKAGALAESAGVIVAVHSWGSGVSVMANIHAGFAMPNCRWLEIPVNSNPLVAELLVEPFADQRRNGRRTDGPGLDIDVTPEVAARYPYQPNFHYHFEERR